MKKDTSEIIQTGLSKINQSFTICSGLTGLSKLAKDKNNIYGFNFKS